MFPLVVRESEIKSPIVISLVLSFVSSYMAVISHSAQGPSLGFSFSKQRF